MVGSETCSRGAKFAQAMRRRAAADSCGSHPQWCTDTVCTCAQALVAPAPRQRRSARGKDSCAVQLVCGLGAELMLANAARSPVSGMLQTQPTRVAAIYIRGSGRARQPAAAGPAGRTPHQAHGVGNQRVAAGENMSGHACADSSALQCTETATHEADRTCSSRSSPRDGREEVWKMGLSRVAGSPSKLRERNQAAAIAHAQRPQSQQHFVRHVVVVACTLREKTVWKYAAVREI